MWCGWMCQVSTTPDTSAGSPARILAWLRKINPNKLTGDDCESLAHFVDETTIAGFLEQSDIAHIADGESTGRTWVVKPPLGGIPAGYIALVDDDHRWKAQVEGRWLHEWIHNTFRQITNNHPLWIRRAYEGHSLRRLVVKLAHDIVTYHGLILVLRNGEDGNDFGDAWRAFPPSDAGEQIPLAGVYRYLSPIDYDTLTDLTLRTGTQS